MLKLPTDHSTTIGFFGTGCVIGCILLVKFSSETPALYGLTAQPVKKTEHQDLYKTVERLAQQAGLPVPTVIVADSTLPNAYTSGLSPRRATIVLTTGLLDTLDPEEARAVIAHELAHVKNRDAAVMTVAVAPLVIAQTIHEWADERWERVANDSDRDKDWQAIPLAVYFAVAGLLWVLGRLLVRLLSRYRELAADRGAVALTGSPAALASALETIDTQIGSLPDDDLRSEDGPIRAFAVVPAKSNTPAEPIRLGADGNRRPFPSGYVHPLRKRTAPWFATHPSIENRLEQLRHIEKRL